MKIDRPLASEYEPYLERYVSLVSESDGLAALDQQLHDYLDTLNNVTEERSLFRYAPNKWSIRQLVGHIVDSERVFAYRAMSIARGELQNLPGFEEDNYAAESGHHECKLKQLNEEFSLVRRSNVLLFKHLPLSTLCRFGSANGKAVSIRALAYVMVGHVRHHLEILRSRYGVKCSR